MSSSTAPLRRVPVDYTLMRQRRPPIAGAGSEVWGWMMGWSWCGYCGYTGRVLGPTQAKCPERNGWHAWLEYCADIPPVLYRGVLPLNGGRA